MQKSYHISNSSFTGREGIVAKKKGFHNFGVKAAKKSGKYDLVINPKSIKALEELGKQANERFEKIKRKM